MKQIEIKQTDKIRALAVAPYPGLKDILEREVKAFPDIQLDVVTGDMEEGVQLARENFHANYDIVISRGGTARLLRERAPLPVIDISISMTDILQAIRLGRDIPGKQAIVGFPNITDRAADLVDMLSMDIDIFTIDQASDINGILEQLKKENCRTVICDVISSRTARSAGFDTILITSGRSSVRRALNDARREVQAMQNMREENIFLRRLLSEHSGETMVFLENGTMYFSTEQEETPELTAFLRESLDDVKNGITSRITRSLNGYLYMIKADVFQVGQRTFIAYYFNRSRSGGNSRMAGISYLTRREVRKLMENSFFRLSGEMNHILPSLQKMAENRLPVLIMGEYGTGRSEAAMEYYLCCSQDVQNYIDIDIQTMNDRSRDFLINNHRSPLFFTGNVIHLKNLGFLNESYLSDLFHTLIHAEVCLSNKVIFSGNPGHMTMQKYIRYIKDKFSCIELELLPLRYNTERIPAIANMYLSQSNAAGRTDVMRIESRAFHNLAAYHWPGNYTQLERVLNQLFVLSKDHMIHAEDVSEVLLMEHDEDSGHSASADYFSLKRPLKEIEKEIIQSVLRENNGNQSAAAKQLGISRTTLWRMLQ
ncbi:MAG: PrpR N-terminal domain-containing protein [Solobacterium sp.]|nr:PrpR N-terminal domain-containing protein [Solobacterium sp.]